MVAPGFDPRTSHTWGKHATTEPMLHHAAKSKYRRCTVRIWQDSFILSCKPVHMILNKKYNASNFQKKQAKLKVGSWKAAADVRQPTLGILPEFYDFAVKLRILHGYPRQIHLACRSKEMPEKALFIQKKINFLCSKFSKISRHDLYEISSKLLYKKYSKTQLFQN